MKKIILTLYVCLSCIMIANARWNPSVVDTLPKRVINGLEVILIRETYESGNIFWTLRVSDFKKCFQRFESKYPGGINYNFNSEEVNKSIYDWEDRLWKIFPSEIKALERFNLNLFVDKNGRVFTVEFSMPDEAFQKLEGFPKNTLKNFYHNLIKEECKTFKKVDFQVLDPDSEGGRQILLDVCGSFGSGNEYTTIFLNKSCYDMFGTFSPWRLPKDEFNRLIKKNEAEMNSQKQEE
ncbi:hypothetical protein DXA50_13570 [Butyricimonas virosa]|jgi:hypothetical protein|uniref:Uncharacterized protein n=1 Tax=Butyricimonas virosa TaxID=544645 RepID=A0A413IKW5_9BACT|nr:hypothetical protein [Butyricimonas virosa]MCI7162204.1 hypothetical protein [Butyricimonas virosa]RGL82838.1 hypothetical protein DXC42_16600 [Butyricimonas virosa]RGY14976.1 hypothetical protein DXA50_13570 [Butyricimonas virosa]RHI16915.1 hypothetical protein DW174_14710 [Butyricimonas virosa]HAH73344.1 hypothetical protein [Butyricimonas virosa]